LGKKAILKLRIFKWRKLRRAGHVARMGRNILVGKAVRKDIGKI
jgi:hypothetical protein